jgi:hypothetical protein
MNTKLYKDSNKNIYSYPADGSQDHLIRDKTPVSQEQADALVSANLESMTQEIFSRLTYAQKRQLEYPSIGDQLDAIWKGGTDADTMKALIQQVKDKYPKPLES